MLICTRFLSIVFILALACAAPIDSANAAKPAPSAGAPAADARAKTLIDKQLKALPEDNGALFATFAKDAVVLLPYGAAKVDVQTFPARRRCSRNARPAARQLGLALLLFPPGRPAANTVTSAGLRAIFRRRSAFRPRAITNASGSSASCLAR